MKSSNLTFTSQTRFIYDNKMDQILDDCANLMSRVERTLFAAISAGKSAPELKSSYLVKFGITARQFNAIKVELEGRIASIKELLPARIQTLSTRIEKLEKTITKIKKKVALHQKKRSLASLKRKLSSLQSDLEKNKVRL